MEFETRFEDPVVLARQIALRWNRRAPFLLRCLSYVRGSNHARGRKGGARKSLGCSRLSCVFQPRAGLKRRGEYIRDDKRKTQRLLEPVLWDLSKNEDNENQKHGNERGIEDSTQRLANSAYFYYLYHDEDSFPSVQVEALSDLRCPLCSMLMPSDSGLILHCRTFHFGLRFDCGKDETNTLHVLVRSEAGAKLLLNERPNANLCFLKSNISKHLTVPFIQRPSSVVLALDPIVRRNKIAKLEDLCAGADVIGQYIRDDKAPLRQYFSSRTNLPLQDSDWDYDSDCEGSEDWLIEEKHALLDDFDDVSNLEKTFIKLWDEFIMSWSIIPDYSIPSCCLEFVRQNGITLIKSNLRQKFLLHLFNLWDFRLVSSRHIATCMAELDSIAGLCP